jgi:hypothetical protein
VGSFLFYGTVTGLVWMKYGDYVKRRKMLQCFLCLGAPERFFKKQLVIIF